jgi:hypothetical protein
MDVCEKTGEKCNQNKGSHYIAQCVSLCDSPLVRNPLEPSNTVLYVKVKKKNVECLSFVTKYEPDSDSLYKDYRPIRLSFCLNSSQEGCQPIKTHLCLTPKSFNIKY